MKKWEKNFNKIRIILNAWDILGVSEVVDDEYDSINHSACSIIANHGTIEELQTMIYKYVIDSMCMKITEEDSLMLAQKIFRSIE